VMEGMGGHGLDLVIKRLAAVLSARGGEGEKFVGEGGVLGKRANVKYNSKSRLAPRREKGTEGRKFPPFRRKGTVLMVSGKVAGGRSRWGGGEEGRLEKN